MRIKMFFKRTALSVIIVGMCAYISALTYLYMQQRNFLFAPSPVEISPSTAGFPQAEVMRLKTHDGESIVTWWVAPQNDKPVTIFFHGNSDRLDKRVERFKIMTSEGDGLLAVSYRGYGGSSGKPSEAGFFEDARTAYEWLEEKVGANRIAVQGYSIGSGVATRLAAEREVKALVLEAPFLSALAVAQKRYWMFPVAWLMTDPFRSDLYLPLVKAPILILHGTADRTVPFEQGKALFALAPEPKKFVAFEWGEHTNLGSLGSLKEIAAFMRALPYESKAQGAINQSAE